MFFDRTSSKQTLHDPWSITKDSAYKRTISYCLNTVRLISSITLATMPFPQNSSPNQICNLRSFTICVTLDNYADTSHCFSIYCYVIQWILENTALQDLRNELLCIFCVYGYSNTFHGNTFFNFALYFCWGI